MMLSTIPPLVLIKPPSPTFIQREVIGPFSQKCLRQPVFLRWKLPIFPARNMNKAKHYTKSVTKSM